MIKFLRLKNIATIESAEVEFFGGFNVLSGETGAGKTVLISSINFILGAKADKTMIRNGQTFCEVEASFCVENSTIIQEVLDGFGVEIEDCDFVDIIIRRKLTIDGKNNIWVNGKQITLTMLKELTQELCDVYGQSEHYSLLKESNQLKVLDSYIGEDILPIKDNIKNIIAEINKINLELESLGGSSQNRQMELDFLKFQINEIESAGLLENEEEDLLEKRKILSSLEKIKDALYSVHSLITGDEKAYDLLRACLNKLGAVCDLSSDYSSLYDRLNSVLVELDDIGETSYDILDKLDLNEEELSKIEDRLDLIKTLKRKYGNSYESIIEYLQNIKIKCENIENFSQKHSELSNQIDLLKNKLNIEYKKLTKLRKEYAVKFSSSVILELVELNMKNAKFDVLVSNNNLELSLNGVDTVEFMFSANSGEPLKNMAKIISGGEMSRFMLALKLVCSNQEIETLIFDEIDAGISGTTGEIVAEKFSKLSKQKQVITISHLPQMVAMADNSYQIKKVEENAITKTNINLLDENGKINEIIRLIGGSADSINAINHAKDMINIANDYKKTI